MVGVAPGLPIPSSDGDGVGRSHPSCAAAAAVCKRAYVVDLSEIVDDVVAVAAQRVVGVRACNADVR